MTGAVATESERMQEKSPVAGELWSLEKGAGLFLHVGWHILRPTVLCKNSSLLCKFANSTVDNLHSKKRKRNLWPSSPPLLLLRHFVLETE